MTNQTSLPLPLANKPRFASFSRWRRHLTAYLFVLPYVLVMLAFGLGPGLYALLLSFADFSTGVPSYFAAGFSNYLAVFKDFRFTFTFGNIAEVPGDLGATRDRHGSHIGNIVANAPRAVVNGLTHPLFRIWRSDGACVGVGCDFHAGSQYQSLSGSSEGYGLQIDSMM